MSLFKIYQNHAVKNNHEIVNQLGWDGASKKLPGVHAHLEMTWGDDASKWNKEFFEFYSVEATVDIKTDSDEVMTNLEQVFSSSNCCGNNFEQTGNIYNNIHGKAHSLSVGDLVKTESGEFFLCCGHGFAKVEVK